MSSYVSVYTTCDICDEKNPTWIYRYKEQIFCRRCFLDHFEIKKCSKCEEDKYIWYKLKDEPLCKICEIKDYPCMRCGKEILVFGKIMKAGPVCAPCSKYFREKKQCNICTKHSREVYTKLYNGISQPVCTSCYNKTLPTCSKCSRKKEPFAYDLKKRPICKKCSEGDRTCQICLESFPAGRGRICMSCSSQNGLIKKVQSAKTTLSPFFEKHFEDFGVWLSQRRGAQFASHHILHYLPWFEKLDILANKKDKFPTYVEVLTTFSVAETKKYLLATRYFDEKQIMPIDKEAKEAHANLDMIDKYIKVFPKTTDFGEMIYAYCNYLKGRYREKKISIRSMRLAMTPSVRFFQYCVYNKEEKPSQELLESYLWCFFGQKSSITSFILFLNREFNYQFSVKEIIRPILKRPKDSNKYLQQRFLSLLRDKELLHSTGHEAFLRVAIGYLHGVSIPRHVQVSFSEIKKSKDGYQIRLAGEIFALPVEVGEAVLSQCCLQNNS